MLDVHRQLEGKADAAALRLALAGQEAARPGGPRTPEQYRRKRGRRRSNPPRLWEKEGQGRGSDAARSGVLKNDFFSMEVFCTPPPTR